MPEGINKVVLAYSGGLDTSVILRWLQEQYRCQVVTFTANLGQGEELEPARAKAEMMGATPIFVEDLRETFVCDYVWPMFRANALYEGTYLLGTSIARPLIARRLVEIAREVGADAIAHGATGKGNDQVRFELSAYALNPKIKVIAPWREWELNSRAKLIEYAESHQIPIPRGKSGEPPYSTDANLLHISYEGRALEDPWEEPDPAMFTRSVAPEEAPDQPTYVELDFERGDPVAVDGERLSPGGAARPTERACRRQRDRSARSGREPLRRHEVAGSVRDARRHRASRRASGDRVRSRSTAAPPTSRTS